MDLRGLGAVSVGMALLMAPLSGRCAAAGSGNVSFNNQIQPILSEYCYHCHGPDSAARKPKKHPMRLDREQFAFEPRDDGKPVIIKGDPKASELVRRITATDDDVMPPASEHKKLKPEEIVLLQKWIEQGAKYEKHWSLIPPARGAVPDAGKGWARDPIDNFVAEKLAENGLNPNPAEDKARLFRRLSFDLTGLPPSPAALRKFLADSSPGAYEKAVDTMLGSDASAEHFARLWLDAVRYADTQGIHHDHFRTIWPYRDWVISALKANMPFDEFTVEQIAGDLLPNATMDEKIASGYNRLLPTTGEGGAIPEEYLAIYARDRVEDTSAVWLGLTAGCANCHDHKFDPISTKEFYSMTAFFRNNTQPGLDSPVSGDTSPLLFVPAKEDRKRWETLPKDIATAEGAIEKRRKESMPDLQKWIGSTNFKLQAANSNEVPGSKDIQLSLSGSNGVYTGKLGKADLTWAPGQHETHTGPFGPAPLVSGEVVSNATPVIARNGQVSYGAMIFIEGKPNGAVVSRIDKSRLYRGWDLFLTEGRPTVHIIDRWPDIALKVTSKQALSEKTWHQVMAVFDGTKSGADAIRIYVDGVDQELEVNNNNPVVKNIDTKAPLRLGGRSDKDAATDAVSGGKVFMQHFAFFDRTLSTHELARMAAGGLLADFAASENRTSAQTNALLGIYLALFDPQNAKLQAALNKLKTEEAALKARGATTLVFEEKKDSQPSAYVLIRGNYTAKGEKVSANVPAALPPLPSNEPRNRVGLAYWMVSRDNPLTARVTVNRLWSSLMGIGIVETTQDFGVMGARPTNQPLLDWLAVEFMDSHWDMRHMIKLMVVSATYRQSEKVLPEKLEKDPQNKLCSRGPHVRLDAEEIRDQALAAAGLLVRKIGGPPVKPYQPEGVWEDVAMKDSNTRFYKQDHGDALYRRSLYTFWKRVAPPPSMEILNAPTREVACTRRDRTDTPLQALVTMNDPEFGEAARRLAEKAVKEEKSFDGRLDRITEALVCRRFAPEERQVVQKLEQRAEAEYAKDQNGAKELASIGESRVDEKLSTNEVAAWTVVASEVMNLDESLTK